MRNLLFLTHRLPFPPNKGDKVRSYHVLKELAREFRVYLGTFLDDPQDDGYVDQLRPLCADIFAVRLNPRAAKLRSVVGFLTGEPLTMPYYRNRHLARWVKHTLREKNIETAVIFSSPMAQYVDGIPGLRVVVDFVDVDSAKWVEYGASHAWPMSWVYAREGKRLLACERSIAHRAARSFFVTPAETALFCQLAPECVSKVESISNGVNAEYFSSDAHRPTPFVDGELPIVFTGAMDYWPNVDAVTWFAAEVLPALKFREPRIRFYIVGMRPGPAVQGLANDSIVVTGTVPDVRPYLQYASVVVAPLRVARGIQNKVLEAMAMGAAVVTSRACASAIEGLEDEVIGAERSDEFVDAVSSLLADKRRAQTMGNRARRFVVDQYGWDQRLLRLRDCLRDTRLDRTPTPLFADSGTTAS